MGILQERIRESQLSTKDHHEVLKSELARRDDTIQKLRRDVLQLQEKRDAAVSEVKYVIEMFEIEMSSFRNAVIESKSQCLNNIPCLFLKSLNLIILFSKSFYSKLSTGSNLPFYVILNMHTCMKKERE